MLLLFPIRSSKKVERIDQQFLRHLQTTKSLKNGILSLNSLCKYCVRPDFIYTHGGKKRSEKKKKTVIQSGLILGLPIRY